MARTVHSLSPHVWEFDPGSLAVEAQVNIRSLQVVSAKPQMQTLGAAIPARIKAEPSQTQQKHQADPVVLNLSVLRSSSPCSFPSVS